MRLIRNRRPGRPRRQPAQARCGAKAVLTMAVALRALMSVTALPARMTRKSVPVIIFAAFTVLAAAAPAGAATARPGQPLAHGVIEICLANHKSSCAAVHGINENLYLNGPGNTNWNLEYVGKVCQNAGCGGPWPFASGSHLNSDFANLSVEYIQRFFPGAPRAAAQYDTTDYDMFLRDAPTHPKSQTDFLVVQTGPASGTYYVCVGASNYFYGKTGSPDEPYYMGTTSANPPTAVRGDLTSPGNWLLWKNGP